MHLFEVTKNLSLLNPDGTPGIEILHTAYYESKERSILALVCGNGYLVFYCVDESYIQPVIRQFHWFASKRKKIKSLCFDPTGAWLLLVTCDASIYIFPVLQFLNPSAKVISHWRTDNITEIKLAGRRVPLTSVRWWKTHKDEHIAIVGSEIGEIAFVNLVSKAEVGGTYITAGIASLDILEDESHETTYLLVTGNDRQQWRLLLEEKKSNFLWPSNVELEAVVCGNNKARENVSSYKDERETERKPHKLSKFESGTFLTPQSTSGGKLVSAYNSASCLLQVLEGNLEQMHLFSYQVPSNCKNILLSEKLIFLTQECNTQAEHKQSSFRILSRKLSELPSDSLRKKEYQGSEIQTVNLDGEVLSLYNRRLECLRVNGNENEPANYKYFLESYKIVKNTCDSISYCHCPQCVVRNSMKYDKSATKTINLPVSSHLDGCYLVQKDDIWECMLRTAPEKLFLSYTAIPTDLPVAERLGVMLGLDINKLYEIAAEIQLGYGHFPQAVHLYQLSKCPQLKRISHFMSYGYLSELVAYIQVLFSTKSVEIVPADKCHFANIALHCFAQQIMEKSNEQHAIIIAFKKFLRENIYYDEAVAVKLLAEQSLFDLLYYLTEVRCQYGLLVETLLQEENMKSASDCKITSSLLSSRYDYTVSPSATDGYMLCMTSPALLQYLAADPSLLGQHLHHLIKLLPIMDVKLLVRLASLYDLSRPITKLALKNLSEIQQQRHRYWSIGATSASNDFPDCTCTDAAQEEDVIKFFVFILLVLCHKLERHNFNVDLVYCSKGKNLNSESGNEERLSVTAKPLACGLSHAAYCKNDTLYTWGRTANGRCGNGDTSTEFQVPQPVNLFLKLHAKVISVSCGALHTLAITDFGVFSWGSSRYGQLGVGEIQRSSQPIIIEKLVQETVIAIQCGQYHSLALTSNGRVYTWGWGVHGQLGHGDPEDCNEPRLVEALQNIAIIALGAGQGHSVVLSKQGTIFAFGCGMFGQLGTGTINKHSIPHHVAVPEPIVLIASGYFHTVAVSNRNRIYVWGCNPQALRLQAQYSRRIRQTSSQNSSQPSQSTASSTTLSPRSSVLQSSTQLTHLVPTVVDSSEISSKICEVSCGSHHSVVVTMTNEVFSWGRNMEGQTGNGTRREQKLPAVVAHLGRKICHATCGADFTIANDCSGRVFGWGKNDYGQIGQKSYDQSSLSAANVSSGRVITIRTNRRMITITQPCRQSLLRPVEINIPVVHDKCPDLDNASYENECAVRQLSTRSSYNRSLTELSNYDCPAYGPYALHATLEAFFPWCDPQSLLQYCLSFKNFQAAAKVCTLQNYCDKAVEYQFEALLSDPTMPAAKYVTLSLQFIEFYTNMIAYEDVNQLQKLLCCVMKIWITYKLPILPLESFLKQNLDKLSYPLSIILFQNETCEAEQARETTCEFLNSLSVSFCLNITSLTMNQISDGWYLKPMDTSGQIAGILGKIHALDNLATLNSSSVPSEHLWQEVLHYVQKGIVSHSSLHITECDVDTICKSFIAEKLYDTKENDSLSRMDTVIFSCNHNFTLQAFRSTILSAFRDGMQQLSNQFPQTLKHLLFNYHLEGIMPTACPKCVLHEIKNEF